MPAYHRRPCVACDQLVPILPPGRATGRRLRTGDGAGRHGWLFREHSVGVRRCRGSHLPVPIAATPDYHPEETPWTGP